MPLNITDKDLEDLNSLPSEDVQAVLGRLSDSELNEYDTATKAWEAKKAAPAPAPEPGLIDKADALWQQTGAPVVKSFQENVGSPLVNKVADQFGPAGKFTVKQLGAVLGGQANVEAMDEKELYHAINAYEDMFGSPTAAATAQFAVQQAGQAPLFFLRAPAAFQKMVAAATEAAPALKLSGQFVANYPRLSALFGAAAKSAGSAAVGAAEGALMNVGIGLATDPNAKPSELAAQGALLGGGVGAVMPAAAKIPGALEPVSKGVKTLAVATRDGAAELMSEMRSHVSSSKLASTAKAKNIRSAGAPGKFAEQNVLPGDNVSQVGLEDIKKPSSIIYDVKADGTPVAHILEIKAPLMGSAEVKYAEIPLDTPAAQTRVGKYRMQHNLDHFGMEDLPGYGESGLINRLTSGAEFEEVVTPSGVKLMRKNEPVPEARPVTILHDGEHIVMSPMGDQYKSPSDSIAVGDEVSVVGAQGFAQDGEVVGAGEGGKVKVKLDSGTVEVEPHQVQHAQPPPPPPEALAESPLARDLTQVKTREVEGEPGTMLPPEPTEADYAYMSAVDENARKNLDLSRQPMPEEFSKLPSSRAAYEDYWLGAPPEVPDPTEMHRVFVRHENHITQENQLAHTLLQLGGRNSLSTLRRVTNLSKKELIESLHSLEGLGLITRVHQGYRLSPTQRTLVSQLPVSEDFRLELMAKQPKQSPPAFALAPGEGAYVERAPGSSAGRGESVHYLGPDSTTPGNVYIRRANGKYASVPAEKVYSDQPPGTSRGPLYPPTPPAPPPGTQLNAQNLLRLDAAKRVAEAVSGKTNWLEKILPAHSYAPQELAELMLRLDGAKTTGALETKLSVLQKMMKQVDQPLYGQFDKDLSAFEDGKLTAQDMSAKYGNVWSEAMQVAQPMLDRVQFLDSELAKMGYVDPALTAARARGEAPQYMARIYEAHLKKPGEHAASLQQKTIDNLADFITTELVREGKTPLPEPVMNDLLEVLRAPNPLDEWVKRAGQGSTPKSFKHLMKRKNLPGPIEAALTPVESGTMRLAYSLAQQETVYNWLKTADAIHSSEVTVMDSFGNPVKENPYWSPGPRKDLTAQVPNDPKRYGKLAGGYVSKQTWEYLSDFSKAHDTIGRLAQTVISYSKMGQVVLNAKTWVNATIGNMEASMLAGGLDIMNPRAVSDMAEAIRQMKVYSQTADVMKAPLVYEAKRYGSDPEGLMSKEYGFVINRMADIIEKAQRNGSGLWEAMSNIKDAVRAAPHDAAKYYNVIDRSFKLANYAVLRKKFYAEAIDKGLSGQAAIDYAAGKASYRIAQSFPMPTRPNKLAQAFQASPLAGILGNPYLTTATELARVHLQLPQRLMREPDLRLRLTLWSGFLAAFVAASHKLAAVNGITQDDIDAAIKAEPDYAKSNRQLTFVLPWWYEDPLRKDANGKPLKSFYKMDLTGAIDMARLTQGDPNDSALARIASNAITLPMSAPLASYAKDLMAKGGMLTPQKQYNTMPRPDQRGLQAMMDDIFARGYGSTGMVQAQKSARQTNLNDMKYKPFQQALTGGQAALQTLVPGTFVGKQSAMKGQMEVASELKDIQKNLMQMATDPEFINADPAKKAKMRQVYIDMMNELRAKQQERKAANVKAGH